MEWSLLNIFILIISFNEAIKLNQNDTEYYNSKGLSLNNLGRYKEGLEW